MQGELNISNCNSCPSRGTCGKQADSYDVQNNEHGKVRHVVDVMSGKGGVGKSGMSILITKEMARRGFRVGVVDAGITGPSIPRLMGLEHAQAFGINDAIGPIVNKDGIKVMSLNFLMGNEDQPAIWHGPIVANAVKRSWTDVIWEELDYLFVDMPPGAGDIALTILQSLSVSEVITISIPQPMISMIVSKATNMCRQVKVEVLRVIENMSYVVCPDCGRRIEVFQHHNVEDFVRKNKMPSWAELSMMDSIPRIYKDDDFDTGTAQQMYAWISPTTDQLIGKMGK